MLGIASRVPGGRTVKEALGAVHVYPSSFRAKPIQASGTVTGVPRTLGAGVPRGDVVGCKGGGPLLACHAWERPQHKPP